MREGHAESLMFISSVVGNVLGAGILWAACAFFAGKLYARSAPAAICSTMTLLTMLAVHYSLLFALGVYQGYVFFDNWLWFVAACLAGPLLGLVGSWSRNQPRWNMILPIGMILEALLYQLVNLASPLLRQTHKAELLVGFVMLAAGITLLTIQVRRRR
ncbi:DUF6518 family protein [Corynebacterium lizhenjunii]|uniref:DUF6518 family protein n=1 Tax=Corynebacterium lizhenjunii TaxID=2709394 RepID=UPI0013E9BE01|nr:DUF6518 family protein [Corynebacterium lizhenjunii]